MPTRLSLHATFASTSMSFLPIGMRKRVLTAIPLSSGLVVRTATPPRLMFSVTSGGDRVAESVRDRNAKNHARAGTAVEIAGEQMRGQRRQDVLQRGVLVDVAGDVQRGKLADLAGIRDRAAEDDDGRLLGIDIAKCAHEADAVGLRQTEIDHDQVNLGEIRFDARDELVAAGNGDGPMPRRFEHRLEAVAHECGVVRDDHRLGGNFRGLGLGRAHVLSIGFAVN